MAAKKRRLVHSGFGKKMALRFPCYLLPNIFSHNYSKSWWNLIYYGRFSNYIELSCDLVQPGPCSSSRLEMTAKRRLLVQSGFSKKMALRFPCYLSPNIFSHNYSKSRWNLSYYGRFSIYIKLSCDLVQPGPCSSSRLEMAAKRRLLAQSGFGKKIAQKVWNNITPDYLREHASSPTVFSPMHQ